MERLRLPGVTLCAVDARSPALAAEALRLSMAQVEVGRVMLLTDGNFDAGPGIEVIDVGPVRSGAEYSHVVLRRLPQHVHTGHVLVTQWDGFVRDASAWSDEFLEYDYIGAVWADAPPARCGGNGGFSLRSRRLLQAGLDSRIVDEHPEDLRLAQTYRALLEHDHGVRFAEPALARRFAFENESPRGATFGFHGPKNLPRVRDSATIRRWLGFLPPEFFRGRDARRLARALLAHRMPGVAHELLQRRLAAGRRDLNTRLLDGAARAARILGWNHA